MLMSRSSSGDNVVDVMDLIFVRFLFGRSDKQISQVVSVHICPENVQPLVREGHNSQKVDGINLIMVL